MSIIAVEITEKKIKFVADSQMTYANQSYLGHKKLFRKDNVLVGVTGSVQALLFFRKLIKERDVKINLPQEENVIELVNGMADHEKIFSDTTEILITDSCNVWGVHPHTNTVWRIEKFEAIGSGANFAIGAYKACGDIAKAVEIACESNINCSLPLTVETVEK